MASLMSPRCTCPEVWRGRGERPACVVHETAGPAPYPPAPRGTKFRMLNMPVEAPDRTPARPAKSRRRDGGECDLMATLGARRGGPVAPDDQVTDWRPWP